jgi:hypothetical protein
MQNTTNRKAYIAFTVTVTTTAVTIQSLWNTLYPTNPLAGNWREVQIQVDPETSGGAAVRIGDGTLGLTVGGNVQKGATLVGGSAADTYRCSGQNAIPLQMLCLQAVTGTVVVNCQLMDI